jgi:hypothetical protein
VSYVEVPAERIRETLTKAGFRLMEPAGYGLGGEEIYFRAHDKDATYAIKVYSSIQYGRSKARGVGQDAIRVVALRFRGQWIGIWKSKRIHRTGTVEGVLERMIERAREAYGFINADRAARAARAARTAPRRF